MFGFGGRKEKGKERKPSARRGGDQNEDDILRSMMATPEEMMKGFEDDPSLQAELDTLADGLGVSGGDGGGNAGGGGGVKEDRGRATPTPTKAPPKPTAAEAYLANMNMSELDDMAALGELREDDIKLTDDDLADSGLHAELQGLGWTDEPSPSGDDPPHQDTPSGQASSAAAARAFESVVAPSVEAAKPKDKSNENHIAELERQIQEARLRAVALSKEDKKAEAVAAMRQIRALETELAVRGGLGHMTEIAHSAQVKGKYDDDEYDDHGAAGGGDDEAGEEDNDALPAPAPSVPSEEAPQPPPAPTSSEPRPGSPPLPKVVEQVPAAASAPLEREGSGDLGVGQARIVQLKADMEKKRKEALALRSAGHMEEALSYMREAKGLETEIIRIQRRNSSKVLLRKSSSGEDNISPGGIADKSPSTAPAPVPPPPVKSDDAFTPLENAITEAKNIEFEEAKRLKEQDSKAAVIHFKKFKEWEAQLETLKLKRTIPNQAPAPFNWNVERQQIKRVLADIPMDKMEIHVSKGVDVYGSKREKGQGPEKVTVSFELPYPKDEPISGKSQHVMTSADASATFDFTTTVDLPRSQKSTEQAFMRRHCTFQIMRRRGMLFKSDEPITQANVELAPLLDHCEIRQNAPLTKEGSRRPVGGHLSVVLRLRVPLKNAEWETIQVKSLVVGEWPDPQTNPLVAQQPAQPQQQQAATPRPASAGPATTPRPPVTPAEPKPATPKPAAVDAEAEKFKDLAEEEKQDPLSVDHLVSNDVLEYEIQLLPTNPDKLDDNDKAIREAQLNMKLNLLVLKVQREEITIDQYVAAIKARVDRDKLLARYLTHTGRKTGALRVLRRIKIMEQELASADQAAEG